MSKGLAIFGSTGSIGRQTLDVVRASRRDFRVVALAGHSNIELLLKQAREFKPATIIVGDPIAAQKLARNTTAEVLFGDAGFARVARLKTVEMIVSAVGGVAGLVPTLAAIDASKKLALANKESLVLAGDIVMPLARKKRVPIYPIDSEHSGVWQLLAGRELASVRRVILTASGGSLRDWPLAKLKSAKPIDVLHHPTWSMGAKITVDSATLANKAFEIIEAHHLFGVPFEKISAVIHPQSLVHALVELTDGSILAQLAMPDMRLPIQLALYEGHVPHGRRPLITPLDLATSALSFVPIDARRYPLFDMILSAGRHGGLTPTVAATASELASARFLCGEIGFTSIARETEKALRTFRSTGKLTLPRVLAAVAHVQKIFEK